MNLEHLGGTRIVRPFRFLAVMVILVITAMPLASACPYIIDLGDNDAFRDTQLDPNNGVYARHRHSFSGGYTDDIHSYQWAWYYPTFYTRTTYSVAELKKLEQRMDAEGLVGTLNALQNLNQNTPKCTVSVKVIDAKVGPGVARDLWSSPLSVPCQIKAIAQSWLNVGDTTRFGRVGEVLALAAFIFMYERRMGLGNGEGWWLTWYWQNRHVLSDIGIRYFGTNPDFELHWSATATEWFAFLLCNEHHAQNGCGCLPRFARRFRDNIVYDLST